MGFHGTIHVRGAHQGYSEAPTFTCTMSITCHTGRPAAPVRRQGVKRGSRRSPPHLTFDGLHCAAARSADRRLYRAPRNMLRLLLVAALLVSLCAAEDPSDPSFLLNRIYRTYTEATESPCVRLLNSTSHIGCGGICYRAFTRLTLISRLPRPCPAGVGAKRSRSAALFRVHRERNERRHHASELLHPVGRRP